MRDTTTKSGGVAAGVRQLGCGLLGLVILGLMFASLLFSIPTLMYATPDSFVTGVLGILAMWLVIAVLMAVTSRETALQKREEARKQAHLNSLVEADAMKPSVHEVLETPEVPRLAEMIRHNVLVAILYLPFFVLLIMGSMRLMTYIMFNARAMGAFGAKMGILGALAVAFIGLPYTFRLSSRLLETPPEPEKGASPAPKKSTTREMFESMRPMLIFAAQMLVVLAVVVVLVLAGEKLGIPPVILRCVMILPLLVVPMYLMYRSFRGMNKGMDDIRAILAAEAEGVITEDTEQPATPEEAAERRESAKEALRQWDSRDASVESRASSASFKYMMAMGAGLVVVLGLVAAVLGGSGISKEAYQGVMIVILLGFMGVIFVGLSIVGKRFTGQMTKEWGVQELEQAMNRGDTEEGLRRIEEIVAKNPTHLAYDLAAAVNHSAGRLDTAEKYARQALQDMMAQTTDKNRDANQPMLANYFVTLGAILISAGRFTESDAVLAQATQLDAKNARAFTNLAESLMYQNGAPELALDYLEKSKRYRAKDASPVFYHLMSAWALARQGDENAADDHAKQAFDGAKPDSLPMMAEMYYYAGRIALAQKRRGDARQAFEKSLGFAPDGLYRERIDRELERLV